MADYAYANGLRDYYEGMEEEPEEMDPALESLADMQPVVEPISLMAWEEREAVEGFLAEDARAEAAAKVAWAYKVRRAA